VVFAATARLAVCCLADVFDVGFGRGGVRSGLDGLVVGGSLLADVVKVGLIADLAVWCCSIRVSSRWAQPTRQILGERREPGTSASSSRTDRVARGSTVLDTVHE